MHYEISNKKIIILRLLANLIDACFIVICIFIFAFFLGQQILLSMVYGALIALMMNILFIFIFPQHYSLGFKVSRLTICDFDGHYLDYKKMIYRQVMITFYWIPFLNLMLLLTNVVAIIIYKNKYIHDFLAKSQVVNQDSALIKVAQNGK